MFQHATVQKFYIILIFSKHILESLWLDLWKAHFPYLSLLTFTFINSVFVSLFKRQVPEKNNLFWKQFICFAYCLQ